MNDDAGGKSALQRGVGRPVPGRANWPRWFDSTRQAWITVPGRSSFVLDDLRQPCALCGWGKHMAIHLKSDGEPPSGSFGLHGWRPANEGDEHARP